MVSLQLKKLFSRDQKSTLTASLTKIPQDAEHVYTTNDRIECKVVVCIRNDLKRDASVIDLSMALVGRSTISFPNLHPWSGGDATRMKTHTFLAMTELHCSKDIRNIYTTESGSRLETEFAFVIPDKLLPSACRHEESGESQVIDSHIHLPPSMEFLDISDTELVKISYVIRIRVRAKMDGQIKSTETELPVKIMPISIRDISTPLPHYLLRTGRKLGVWSASLDCGRLSARVRTPLSLRVLMSKDSNTMAGTSTLDLSCLFESSSLQNGPPQLKSIRNKLHAYTYASLTPFEHEPMPEEFADYVIGKTMYHESLILGQLDLGSLIWTFERNNTRIPAYVISLQLPITLSGKQKMSSSSIAPSFSSCLVCRNYVLETRISYSESRIARKSWNKTLKIMTPLQVKFTP